MAESVINFKAAQKSIAERVEFDFFDLAPVSLWLEDYCGIKCLFDRWRRDGVSDLRQYLRQNPADVAACSAAIRVVKVNARTLALFEADSSEHLLANLGKVFRDDMFDRHVEELAQLWEGKTEFSRSTVNYTLSGRRLDVQLSGRIVPGHEAAWDRVLVAIEDVSEREDARRLLLASEDYARGLFDHSPVSLWVEDFSSVKKLIDGVREAGISDFRTFTDVHPEFVERCMREIRVVDVNRHTLALFEAPDRASLLQRIADVFREDMRSYFREQLVDLWDGKLFQQREVVNYTLNGAKLHLHLQLSVLPGHETEWTLVQIALTDITARKKAEAYLEFLGKHDPVTGLYNRSYYVEELNRLERKAEAPVTMVVADLNGLKRVNDELGHAAGDAILRRFGEVLTELVTKPCCAARIGGDEFAVLMPGANEEGGAAMMADIDRLVAVNNQFHAGSNISVSLGAATGLPDERLESVFSRADARMYEAKRALYSSPDADRRRRRRSA